MDLRVGMFVRFTDRDDSGKYHHDGEVVSLENGQVSFATAGAILSVPMVEQGKFEEVERPVGWVSAPAVETVAKKKKSLSERAEHVAAIVRANPEMSRKDLIALVVEQLGMSAGGASTYVALARKNLR